MDHVWVLDETGDARGIGGDKKHAAGLLVGLGELGVEVHDPGVYTPNGWLDKWLIVTDVFSKSGQALQTIESWPGKVCQLLLCREENYGRRIANREYATRMLDRADLIVQTGPFTDREAATIPYIPWTPEPEMLAIPRSPVGDDASYWGYVLTGTLRAGKGQREYSRFALKHELPLKVLMLGNSVMWFSEDLRELLLKEFPDAVEDPSAYENVWLNKDGSPKKTKRERPWRICRDEHQVYYAGAYAGVSDLAWYFGRMVEEELYPIHVNPTRDDWSPGHLEYTTLEAMAAGLVTLVMDHVDEAQLYPNGRTLEEVTRLHDPKKYAASLLALL